MNHDSIIFDLDGTLWNTCKGCAKTWNDVLSSKEETFQTVTEQDMERAMGQDKEGFRRLFFSDLPYKQGHQLLTEIFSQFNQKIPLNGWELYKGVEQGLAKLCTKYPMFIVSNCQEGYLQTFNQCTSIVDRYIQDYEYIGRSLAPKHVNIASVATRNKLRNPIYIGDTKGDQKAAKQADIDFAHAAYGFGEIDQSKWSFDTFDEIVEFFNI